MSVISEINRLEYSSPIEVPKVIDDKQVAAFVDNGYIVVPDLVMAAELDEMCADLVQISRGVYPCEGIEPLPAATPEKEVLRNILCIHQAHYISPVIEKYVRHPQVCGVLSQITAAHLPYWDGSVMCMQSMMFVKPPGFQGQAWHQDEIYIPTRDRSLVGAWIALDDATLENGCLHVLPQSHREGLLFPQRPHGDDDEFDFADESYGFDDTGEVPVEVARGSVVFFNGYLLHRSRRNSSDGYRRALVNHYCNAWSRLPWKLKDGETAGTNHRTGCVHVAGVDPYHWMGKEAADKAVRLRTCKANEGA